MDFEAHLDRMIEFSYHTFGPGRRTKGVLDHIRKEIKEVEENPTDLEEWVDLIILSIDGAWRSGHAARDIVRVMLAKQAKNESRSWPDWRTADPDKAIEHVRTPEEEAAKKRAIELITIPKFNEAPDVGPTYNNGGIVGGKGPIHAVVQADGYVVPKKHVDSFTVPNIPIDAPEAGIIDGHLY